MTPIVDMVKEAACVIIAPTSRYVSWRYCASTNHLKKYKTENYDTEIQEWFDSHIQMLGTWASEHGLNYVILDPITVEETSVSTLRDRTASSGEPLWSAADGVHLLAGGTETLRVPSWPLQNSCPQTTWLTRQGPSPRGTAPLQKGPGWTRSSPSLSVYRTMRPLVQPG